MFKVVKFLIPILFALNCFASSTPSYLGGNLFIGSSPPSGLPPENPIPTFVGMDAKVTSIAINGGWQSTGVIAQHNKSVTFEWKVDDVKVKPRQYLVVYRLDYRFDKNPVIIYRERKNASGAVIYTADYLNYEGVANLSVPLSASSSSAKIERTGVLNKYFGMLGRGIDVKDGDTLNVALVSSLPSGVSEIGNNPLASSPALSLYDINTTVPGILGNNNLLNMSADEFCKYTPDLKDFIGVCQYDIATKTYVYKPKGPLYNVFGGIFSLGSSSSSPISIPSCNSSVANDYFNLFKAAMDYLKTPGISSNDLDKWLVVADNHFRNYLKKGGGFAAAHNSYNPTNLPADFAS
jgi:hypothetical protein